MKKILIIAFVLFQITAIAQIRFEIQSTKVNKNNTGFSNYTPETGYVLIDDSYIYINFRGKSMNFVFVESGGKEETNKGTYSYATYLIDNKLVDMALHVSIYGNVYLYMCESVNYVVEFKLVK